MIRCTRRERSCAGTSKRITRSKNAVNLAGSDANVSRKGMLAESIDGDDGDDCYYLPQGATRCRNFSLTIRQMEITWLVDALFSSK